MKPNLPDNLKPQVLSCIKRHTSGNDRITKSGIARACGLRYTSTTDRQIRDAVAELRKEGEPLCSDSGKAGYYYSLEDRYHTIAELRSRGTELLETARALERGPRDTVQMGLALWG